MIINHMQCSNCRIKQTKNGERGNPPWWLTWPSPRIRINWWKHQRWIMSAMQWGIILSKHGLPANTQACAHMVRGLTKAQRQVINLLYFRLFINIFPIMQQLVRCIYFIHSHKNLCYWMCMHCKENIKHQMHTYFERMGKRCWKIFSVNL